MIKEFSFDEMLPTLIDKLKSGGQVSFTVTGNSMRPLFHDKRDTVTLSAPCGRLKKYDIPFYHRSDGKYILHRIVKVGENDYTARGDNCSFTEYGIKDEDIIGVVKAYTRKGKARDMGSYAQRFYAAIWANGFSFFIRKRLWVAFLSFGSKVKRTLLKPFKNK